MREIEAVAVEPVARAGRDRHRVDVLGRRRPVSGARRRRRVSGAFPARDGGVLPAALSFRKPAVAAVNGHAIAGGCIIAAACDHRVMAEGSGRIGIPELAVGVPFPALPFEIVQARRVAASISRSLVLAAADTVLPSEALALGLIDEIATPDR